MTIQLTGRMRISGPDGVAESSDLPGRQGRLVLASLAVTEQPVPREILADRVWGDRLPKAWERDLSAVVSKLRAVLAQVGLGGPDVITGSSGTYELRLPPDCDVDVRRARQAAVDARSALDDGRPEEAVALAAETVEIADRPFLSAEDDLWIDTVRSELGQLRLRARDVSAEAYGELGRTRDAVAELEAALLDDPFREAALRRLMQLHLDTGNRAEAVRVYERSRELLAEELGVDPSPATEQLYLTALRATSPTSPGGTTPAPAAAAPQVRYARSGRVNIAYQVIGDGPVDLVAVPGWVSNIELAWQEPHLASFLRGVAESCRLILFDKRGTGLSDPIPLDEPPPLDIRMDDVTAVMDAVGSEQAALFGFSEGGAMSLLFAAAHPERTLGLMLWGTWCRQIPDDDFPLGWTREEGLRRFVQPIREHGRPSASWFAPSREDDPDFQAWFSRYARQSASPGMAIALLRANARMDVRHVLPSVRVPTLVLHRTNDVLVDVRQGRYIAEHVPGARMVEFTGEDHWPWLGDEAPAILAEMTDFLGRLEAATPVQQVLATLVAVDVRERPATVEEIVREHRGVPVESDPGLLIRFDRPGRAVECARALVTAMSEARAGVHTGEIDLAGAEVRGLAVDVVRAVRDEAGAGEVLVTRTVTDLVAGSPLTFQGRGTHELGSAGQWQLFSST